MAAAVLAVAVLVNLPAWICPTPSTNDTLFGLDPKDPHLQRVAAANAAACCTACFNGPTSTVPCATWSFQNKYSPSTPCHLSALAPVSTKPRKGCAGGTTKAPTTPTPSPPPPAPAPKGAKSVLLLIADDLRAQMNESYGQHFVHTENIDALAKSAGAVVFNRAYAQLAWCSPSRNSFLSGRYPDTLQIWDFGKSFRTTAENPPAPGVRIVPMPAFFKEHGYLTLGAGGP
jgi:hypothetical protein